MTNTFQHTAHLYDIDQFPADQDDLAFYLQKATQYGSPILELACGTGRVMIHLAEAGFSIQGLDLSSQMLSVFEQKCQQLPVRVRKRMTVKQGRMDDFSFDNSFKLILIPFHSFQALLSDEEARHCLRCIHRHLDQDGAFILNVSRFDNDFIQHWQPGLETQESMDFLADGGMVTRYTILQELDEEKHVMSFDNLYRVSATAAEFEEYRDRLQVRYYSADELRRLLQDEGFHVIEEMGWYDGTPVHDEEEMIFVCRRR